MIDFVFSIKDFVDWVGIDDDRLSSCKNTIPSSLSVISLFGGFFSFDESDEWSNNGDEEDRELFVTVNKRLRFFGFVLLFASNGLFVSDDNDDDDELICDLSFLLILSVEKSSSIRSGFEERSNVISNNGGGEVVDGFMACTEEIEEIRGDFAWFIDSLSFADVGKVLNESLSKRKE